MGCSCDNVVCMHVFSAIWARHSSTQNMKTVFPRRTPSGMSLLLHKSSHRRNEASGVNWSMVGRRHFHQIRKRNILRQNILRNSFILYRLSNCILFIRESRFGGLISARISVWPQSKLPILYQVGKHTYRILRVQRMTRKTGHSSQNECQTISHENITTLHRWLRFQRYMSKYELLTGSIRKSVLSVLLFLTDLMLLVDGL